MNSTPPTVSIIVATRNRAEHLEIALQCIKAQSHQDFEVIVIDDGSSTDTLQSYDRIWAALDNRFILVPPVAPNALGTGPANARNRGIERAQGEFIAFLDDDDKWIASDHLEVGLKALRQFDGDFFFANMQGYRGDRVTRPDWFDYAPYLKRNQRMSGPPSVYEVALADVAMALRHRALHPDVMIIRRSLVQKIAGFNRHAVPFEDWNFAFHVADESRRTLYRGDVVASYRFPEGNSVSLNYTHRPTFHLQELSAVQEVRVNCKSRLIRRSARAHTAWVCRSVAQMCIDKHEGREALSFAWQALCTYPTLGAFACFTKALVHKIGLRF